PRHLAALSRLVCVERFAVQVGKGDGVAMHPLGIVEVAGLHLAAHFRRDNAVEGEEHATTIPAVAQLGLELAEAVDDVVERSKGCRRHGCGHVPITPAAATPGAPARRDWEWRWGPAPGVPRRCRGADPPRAGGRSRNCSAPS